MVTLKESNYPFSIINIYRDAGNKLEHNINFYVRKEKDLILILPL
jgi:hypothetical protein